MAVYRVKRSFSSGELSPLLEARTELSSVKQGCRILRNMHLLPQGPVTRRNGLEYLNALTYDPNNASTIALPFYEDIISYRQIPFVFSAITSYNIIFLSTNKFTYILFSMGDGYDLEGTWRDAGLIPDPIDPTIPYLLTLDRAASGLSNPKAFNIEASEFDYAQVRDVMYIAQSDIPPLQLSRLGHDNWEIIPMTFVGPPAEWNYVDYENVYGYPSKVSFYEQRSVWASSPGYPDRIWISEAGNFINLTLPTELLPSSPITAVAASGQLNKIEWLSSANELLMGTSGDEWTIGAGNQEFTPQTIQILRQTNQGGESLKPEMINSNTIFLERLSKTVNALVYSEEYGGYVAKDLSIIAPHITENKVIIDWAYQQTPHSILWVILDDGTMAGLTYQAEHEVLGWHTHDTHGSLISVNCTPNKYHRETDTWFMVRRLVNDKDVLYLERFHHEFVENTTAEAFFVDSGKTYVGVPKKEFNVPHLANTDVAVLADGGVLNNIKSDAAGVVTLPKEYGTVTIGLPFTSVMSPIPIELELDDGSSPGRVQRVYQLMVRFYKTVGGHIIRTSSEGSFEEEELVFRVPANATGYGVPLYTGNFLIPFPEGYDNDVFMSIVQRQPLPMTILSLTDHIEIYDMLG